MAIPITKEDLNAVGMLGEKLMKTKVKVLLNKRKLTIVEIKTKNPEDIVVLDKLISLMDFIISDIDNIKGGL